MPEGDAPFLLSPTVQQWVPTTGDGSNSTKAGMKSHRFIRLAPS